MNRVGYTILRNMCWAFLTGVLGLVAMLGIAECTGNFTVGLYVGTGVFFAGIAISLTSALMRPVKKDANRNGAVVFLGILSTIGVVLALAHVYWAFAGFPH